MSRLFPCLLKVLGREHLPSKLQVFSMKFSHFARANSTQVIYQQCSHIQLSWHYIPVTEPKHNQLFKFPEHSNLFSFGIDKFLLVQDFGIVDKHLPPLCPSSSYNRILENVIYEEEQTSVLDRTKNEVYLMGSLLKKRREKMNRQKYKKRRKRDRFKREALKNLREKKKQRKERAAARKQLILSKMVVNKVISKRRARYLSHKLLPGFVKRQMTN